jgi:chromosomal replication initiator protein
MIRIADVQRVVAGAYGITVADLKEPDQVGAREPKKAKPRQLAMYLARKHCRSVGYGDRPVALTHVGRCFNRDHTTVIYAVKTVAEKREKSKQFDVVVSCLERQIMSVDRLPPPTFLLPSAGA